jgi:hypothetical protein
MGCSSSTTVQSPDGYKEDRNFVEEANKRRVTFNKKSGQAETVAGPRDKPESDFFEAVEAGHGE